MTITARLGAVALAVAVGASALVAAGPASAVDPEVEEPAVTEEPTRTVVPVRLSVSPDPSDVYGTGQLVTARFSQPVTRKANVENAITVSSEQTLGAGSWGWINDQTAVYRPKKFWPANADITFTFTLKGVVMGQTDTTTLVGSGNRSYTLQTGRSFVMKIRDSKHRLYVEQDGKPVRSFPVSLGKKGWETYSGIKILTHEKYVRLRMTGYDPGTKDRWDVVSPWSIRLTPTGEFIHGAPWAAYRMGKANGSHGCTNMFPKHAKWLYQRVRAGDPVVTKGTGRPMATDNGTPGAYWNYSWKQWLAKSAVTGTPAKTMAQSVPPITRPSGP